MSISEFIERSKRHLLIRCKVITDPLLNLYNYSKALNRRATRKNRKTIAIIYIVPLTSNKFGKWKDGFTEGVNQIVAKEFDIIWINLALRKPNLNELNLYDFILVKSTFSWAPDKFIRSLKPNLITKIGLLISGVTPPPKEKKEVLKYDVLFYETYWYRNQIDYHPNIYHSFGIYTDFMQPDAGSQKDIDYLTIGCFRDYKRMDRLITFPGKKVAVGEVFNWNSAVIKELQAHNVEVLDFVPYDQLSKLINRSKNVYIPAKIDGGGERAVLEARSCNVNVIVEDDNPKLQELISSPIYDHNYYGSTVLKGIKSVFES